MELNDFQPGDKVQVQPETTEFDLPIWLIREKGVVLSLGRKRVRVQLEGSVKAIYAILPKDLKNLSRPSTEAATAAPATDPGGYLDSDDWELIREVMKRAAARANWSTDSWEKGRQSQLQSLSDALHRPAIRQLCNQCDDLPRDKYASGPEEEGLCARCIEQNRYASLLPENFDDDASQDYILEKAIGEMADVYERARKLREQCEKEEFHAAKTMWYLWTQEIREVMGWTEKENDIFVRYFYEPPKDES